MASASNSAGCFANHGPTGRKHCATAEHSRPTRAAKSHHIPLDKSLSVSKSKRRPSAKCCSRARKSPCSSPPASVSPPHPPPAPALHRTSKNQGAKYRRDPMSNNQKYFFSHSPSSSQATSSNNKPCAACKPSSSRPCRPVCPQTSRTASGCSSRLGGGACLRMARMRTS